MGRTAGEMQVTKNNAAEEARWMADLYAKVAEAEQQLRNGEEVDVWDALQALRETYHE